MKRDILDNIYSKNAKGGYLKKHVYRRNEMKLLVVHEVKQV